MTLKLKGIFAALVTPLDEAGRFSPGVLHELIDSVIARGVTGICIGGATSESVHLDLEDRKGLIVTASEAVAGRVPLLSAIGSSSLSRVLALAEQSAASGCTALLVPTPYFYNYEQRDLETFCRHVFSTVSLPCLIYHLPQYTSALEIETLQRLLVTAQNVVGVKDSSGETGHLSRLAMAREQSDFSLLIGDDRRLLAGLSAGWDGAISGAACLCPELLVRIYNDFRRGDRTAAEACQALLDQLLGELERLPFPWGIRVGLGVRGVPTGPLSLPLAPMRKQQIAQFRGWLDNWLGQQHHLFS
jgi:4-hydroxy-tetrahydrodipicolinate synthase